MLRRLLLLPSGVGDFDSVESTESNSVLLSVRPKCALPTYVALCAALARLWWRWTLQTSHMRDPVVASWVIFVVFRKCLKKMVLINLQPHSQPFRTYKNLQIKICQTKKYPKYNQSSNFSYVFTSNYTM